MSRRSRAGRRSAAGLAALLMCLGCSAEEDPAPEQPEAEASSGSAATDPGVTTEEGESVVTTYAGLPPGFPQEAVPVADEDAITSGSVSEYDGITAYTVIVESDEGPVDTLSDAVETLVDAGLEGGDTEVPAEGEDPIPVTLFGEGPDTVVVLSSIGRDTDTLLTYTVEVS